MSAAHGPSRVAGPGRRPALADAGSFLVAAVRRFYDDQCLVRASALAYTSLLSMVPFLAVTFAVLKGLGVQDRLEGMLLHRLSLSPAARETIIGYVDRTNFGTLGGLGAALLLLTVISLLGSVESSFNAIWRVARDRTPWRKVSDYLSVVLLTPFLLLAAVALTSSLQSERAMQWLLASRLGGMALQSLALVPIVFNVVALGALYAIMPNRRAAPGAVAVGALFAGVGWHLVQIAYIRFQIGVASYDAIYGAFSQLPLTLVWLYVSWAIVLLGAEIAALWEFGWRHMERNAREPDPAALALHLLLRAAEAFESGGDALDLTATARRLHVAPERLQVVAEAMRSSGWLASVEGQRQRFVLAADPRRIDLAAIGDLRMQGAVPVHSDARVAAALERIEESEREARGRLSLADVLGGGASAAPPQRR